MSEAPGFDKNRSADQPLATPKWAFVSVELVACYKYLVSYMIDGIRVSSRTHRSAPMSADKSELRPQRTAATGRNKWQPKLATPFGILRTNKVLREVFGREPAPPDFPIRAGGLLGLRLSAFCSASSVVVLIN